jgi:protein gp37
MEKSWVLNIKSNCEQLNIPFFFKQWGKREFNPDLNDPTLKKEHPLYTKGGCMIDNRVYREYPNNKDGITNKY